MPFNQQQQKKRRRPRSRYGQQLHEKQTLKEIFGVRETQLRNYYKTARASSKETGPHMITLLEARLDNALYRAGFAETRAQARQLASHRLCTVNARPVDVPSYSLRVGDVVAIRPSKRTKALFTNLEKKLQNVETPGWIQLNPTELSFSVTRLPEVAEAGLGVDMQAIVEMFAR